MNAMWAIFIIMAVLIIAGECYMVRDEPFVIAAVILSNCFLMVMAYALRYL